MKYEFPYEQQAVKNEPLPEALTGINALTYYAFCYVYKLYDNGNGTINKAQGGAMKAQIMSAIEATTGLLQKYKDMWQRAESSAREYALNPSIENADLFYAAVYNLPNDWRLKR